MQDNPYSPLFLFLALFVAGTNQAKAEPGDWQFIDVTSDVVDTNPPGIGPVFDYAFLDINDDNYLDIVVNNHHQAKPSPIWLGTPDHKFKFWQNMPKEWLPIAGFHLGEVDHNGDGKTDLVCTGNEGGVIINLNTTEPGAFEPSFDPVPIHSSSHLVSFIDFDGDGKLETLVRPGQIFRDIKEKPVMTGKQFGCWTVADFNNDGWPDLFAAGVESRRKTWSGPRKIFRNNKGKLEELKSKEKWLAEHFGGIPKAADFNNDGNFDIYVFGGSAKGADLPMRLYLGDGKLGFDDVSEKAEIAESKQKTGYSHVYVADIDNDSYLDFINEGNYGTYAWKNNGDGTFSMLPKELNGEWAASRHLRLDDFDMDGRLDVVTAGPGPGWKDRPDSIRVFRNTTENGNHWLKLQLRQDVGNTMCIGAVVTLFETGTRNVVGKRMVYADTEGYHPRLHFGLGKHTKVDIEVVFPTTKEKKLFPGVKADRYLVLRPDGSSDDVKFGQRSSAETSTKR